METKGRSLPDRPGIPKIRTWALLFRLPMDETISLHINFVVEDPDGSWRLLLLEGPWDDPLDPENLRKVQKRISDCVTASINGYLAERYPESLGRSVVIQVDSYDTPRAQMDALLQALQRGIDTSPEIQSCIQERNCVANVRIVHNWMDWNAEFEKRHNPPKVGLIGRILKRVGLR
ncbi:MAG TPA: hypothetical protein VGQ36_26080 [Thermoanaerobaculia bacterium]|nr:hypothetical protein [Thermoanaerobaculia bacterium]